MIIKITGPDGNLLWEGQWQPNLNLTMAVTEEGHLYFGSITDAIVPPWKIEITPVKWRSEADGRFTE